MPRLRGYFLGSTVVGGRIQAVATRSFSSPEFPLLELRDARRVSQRTNLDLQHHEAPETHVKLCKATRPVGTKRGACFLSFFKRKP